MEVCPGRLAELIVQAVERVQQVEQCVFVRHRAVPVIGAEEPIRSRGSGLDQHSVPFDIWRPFVMRPGYSVIELSCGVHLDWSRGRRDSRD